MLLRPWKIGLLAVLASALLSGCINAKVSGENLVRARPGAPLDVAAARAEMAGYRVTEQRLPMADGVSLYAVAFTRPDAHASVLYFGGNAYLVGPYGLYTAQRLGAGVRNVILVDHRGYGASAGTPTLEAMFADAPQVYDAVRAWPEVAGKPLIVHGQSIGSFMAGEIARLRHLDGLVLESSMTTGAAWGQMYEDHWLVRRVDVEESLREAGNLPVMRTLDEPLLLLVGEKDEATPPRYSRELYEAAAVPAERKQLVVMAGRGHNDVTADPSFAAVYAGFIDQLDVAPAGSR